MTELIWNEGMSVGMDAIDKDHKQIIAILAIHFKLSEDLPVG
jgi:two-component system cell cycle response regulator